MTLTITLLSAAMVFGVAALHPFTTYPLSLLLARRLFTGRRDASRRDGEGLPAGSCAICLCAYNEAETIRENVENLLEQKRQLSEQDIDVTIHVYCDSCTDDTVAILEPYGDRIRLVVGRTRAGKSTGMNTLLAQVDSDFVVFTDADVMFDVNAVRNLLLKFHDPAVGCVLGNPQYTNSDETPTATTGSSYWRFEEFLKQLESDTGTVMGAAGAIFAIRRELYREVPSVVIDDMFTSMSIVCDGYRAVRAPDAVAYIRFATSSSDEFRRKVRIACRAFNCHRLLLPRLLRMGWWNLYKYVSHKLLRWFVGFSLAAAAVCTVIAGLTFDPAIGLTLLLALGVAIGLLAVPWRWKFVNCIRQTLMAFYGVATGILLSLRGERFRTWEPPASARSVVKDG